MLLRGTDLRKTQGGRASEWPQDHCPYRCDSLFCSGNEATAALQQHGFLWVARHSEQRAMPGICTTTACRTTGEDQHLTNISNRSLVSERICGVIHIFFSSIHNQRGHVKEGIFFTCPLISGLDMTRVSGSH